MADRNQLEPMADGFVAFHDEQGRRWKHKDMADARVGPGYRVFIGDDGEERRYAFGEKESHDATISDLRDQLRRSVPATDMPATDAPPPAEPPPPSA